MRYYAHHILFFCYNMSKIITPTLKSVEKISEFHFCLSKAQKFVENNGFEPLTPCLQSRCSSQLS